jgi:UDP-N-acetylmuramyl tripeptide synthase
MAGIAEKFAEEVVLTDDNPRFEASGAILQDMLAGLQQPERVTVLADRATAIAHTLRNADVGDVVLIAGKGHEDYQDVRGVRWAFSDYGHALDILEQRFGQLSPMNEQGRADA